MLPSAGSNLAPVFAPAGQARVRVRVRDKSVLEMRLAAIHDRDIDELLCLATAPGGFRTFGLHSVAGVGFAWRLGCPAADGRRLTRPARRDSRWWPGAGRRRRRQERILPTSCGS